jgi:hypothetical protein
MQLSWLLFSRAIQGKQQQSKQITPRSPPQLSFLLRDSHATSSSSNMTSTAHSSSSRIWSELPAEIMQQIVLLLPLQDRLTSCALISTAWAAAVAAAPVSCVELEHRDAASVQRVWQRYLAKLDCQQLTRVRLAVDNPFEKYHKGWSCPVKGLPAGLQDLELSGLSLGLNASAEQLQSARRLRAAHTGDNSDSEGGTAAAAAAAAAKAEKVQHGLPVDALASLTRLRLDNVPSRQTTSSISLS